MSSKKTTKAKAAAVPEEAAEEAAAVTLEAEQVAAAVTAAEAEAAEPVVYLGPDIRHVAKSGTTFTNGLPAALTKKIEEIPAIKGLLIPVPNLYKAMESVGVDGTALNNLYKAVGERLKNNKGGI